LAREYGISIASGTSFLQVIARKNTKKNAVQYNTVDAAFFIYLEEIQNKLFFISERLVTKTAAIRRYETTTP